MKATKKALGFGVLVWLVPFVVAILVFPFHESWRALFESVMAVAVAGTAVLFGWLYFRKLPTVESRDGVIVGIVWWVLCVAIDMPMITAGPMEMSLAEYFADIGLTYVSIPLITIGMASAFNWKPDVT